MYRQVILNFALYAAGASGRQCGAGMAVPPVVGGT
jgi:hypothetical protein